MNGFRKRSMHVCIIAFVIALTHLHSHGHKIEQNVEETQYLRPAIINGAYAEPGRYKWIVSLQANGDHICGGVLLNADLVLSAAHCFFPPASQTPLPPGKIKVVVGQHDLSGYSPTNVFQVRSIVWHKYFKPAEVDPNMPWDIALLQLKSPIPLTMHDQGANITLPGPFYEHSPSVRLVGWGITDSASQAYSRRLKTAELTVLSPEICQARHRNHPVSDYVVCTDSTTADACYGDSGSPLVNEHVDRASGARVDTLVGISSLAVCGKNQSASIFTRVSMYTDFLETEMKRMSQRAGKRRGRKGRRGH